MDSVFGENANTLVKVTVGAGIVFGSLYVLDSFGAPGMLLVAAILAMGVLLAHQENKVRNGVRRTGN